MHVSRTAHKVLSIGINDTHQCHSMWARAAPRSRRSRVLQELKTSSRRPGCDCSTFRQTSCTVNETLLLSRERLHGSMFRICQNVRPIGCCDGQATKTAMPEEPGRFAEATGEAGKSSPTTLPCYHRGNHTSQHQTPRDLRAQAKPLASSGSLRAIGLQRLAGEPRAARPESLRGPQQRKLTGHSCR